MHYVKAKGILSANNGINLYRGCTHGCIYCDSRSHCYHMDHAFEDIEVKENALELLENALKRKRKKCMIATGSMSDPYMPLERDLQYTRKALSLIAQYGHGFTVITKSDLILRDLDLIQHINDRGKCVVQMTLTTYDDTLCRILEPNVATTKERFAVLKILRDMGIPTVVWLCPILPFINDTRENITQLLELCIEAKVIGILCFGMELTLREGNREYFYAQLDRFFPCLKEHYIKNYGNQYIITSPYHKDLMKLFHDTCEAHGILHQNDQIFAYLQHMTQKAEKEQLSLW